jgi:hypothetical protein
MAHLHCVLLITRKWNGMRRTGPKAENLKALLSMERSQSACLQGPVGLGLTKCQDRIIRPISKANVSLRIYEWDLFREYPSLVLRRELPGPIRNSGNILSSRRCLMGLTLWPQYISSISSSPRISCASHARYTPCGSPRIALATCPIPGRSGFQYRSSDLALYPELVSARSA